MTHVLPVPSVKGRNSRTQDKGHLEELRGLARHVRGECDVPIFLASLVETARVSFVVAGVEDYSRI